MPRYYFDIHDGERLTRDEEGIEYEARKAVRDAAIGVLPAIVQDELPDGGECGLTVKVRDETGRYIFQATLSIKAEWFDGESEVR